jgi:hypothetical protein
MSAVAAVDVHPTESPVHEVPSAEVEEVQAAEQKRWMTAFGIPLIFMALFVGLSFATGDAWWLGLAIASLLVDIFVLVWLCLSSDTNGLIGEPASH